MVCALRGGDRAPGCGLAAIATRGPAVAATLAGKVQTVHQYGL
jgi:hypothetical protein